MKPAYRKALAIFGACVVLIWFLGMVAFLARTPHLKGWRDSQVAPEVTYRSRWIHACGCGLQKAKLKSVLPLFRGSDDVKISLSELATEMKLLREEVSELRAETGRNHDQWFRTEVPPAGSATDRHRLRSSLGKLCWPRADLWAVSGNCSRRSTRRQHERASAFSAAK